MNVFECWARVKRCSVNTLVKRRSLLHVFPVPLLSTQKALSIFMVLNHIHVSLLLSLTSKSLILTLANISWQNIKFELGLGRYVRNPVNLRQWRTMSSRRHCTCRWGRSGRSTALARWRCCRWPSGGRASLWSGNTGWTWTWTALNSENTDWKH